MHFVDNFEHALANEAKKRGLDGVICGHIHHAEIRTIDGIEYCNDGDWVESLSALVEMPNGELKIIRWQKKYAEAHAEISKLYQSNTALSPITARTNTNPTTPH
ncbi:UDP-2,3-diacylglucosamine diphosphatase [Deefgea sp. CFH1-16]|uniref:UDP-2,3-diacylglucosamine diphosphatase n=1 Tax=Deefgea sp. CFH1-16 TaxID=2675457 RepID=UPI001FFD2168|nr:hypothetical protein [Deefgea sp. CFH1-16]